jgi:hypothetical protein
MSTAAGSNNKKFLGGAGVQKELQGFAAFVAYQECHCHLGWYTMTISNTFV